MITCGHRLRRGGMLRHAALRYAARATGITLSTQQERWIAKQVEAEHLESRIAVQRKD